MAGELMRSRRYTRTFDVPRDDVDDRLDEIEVRADAAQQQAQAASTAAEAANAAATGALFRGNHQGQQPASSISDFALAVQDRLFAVLQEGASITLDKDPLTGLVTISSGGGAGVDSFETVSKNLASEDAALTYNGSGDLIEIAYASGVIKTLAYTDGALTSITLSGSTPSGIELVKTLTYTGDDLTDITYS